MFNPYGNPYAGQFQPQQQNFQPAQMQFQPSYVAQPAAPQQSTPAVMYTPMAKDFGSVSLQPGKQALIIAQNEPFMAFKSADTMGMVTTSIYRIEPVTDDDITSPAPEYATKRELAQLQQIVQQLIEGMGQAHTESKEAMK